MLSGHQVARVRGSGIALGAGDAFTLIELILVMAILTVAVAITAPSLSNFFRGRSLDSEARRLLALTRQGQSRAVSEGIPMELWMDVQQRKIGLEAEPSYSSQDPRSVEYTVQTDFQVDSSPGSLPGNSLVTPSRGVGITGASVAKEVSNHPNLPRIRFLPDGYIAESSPQRMRLASADGVALYLVQSTNRLSYEIRSNFN
jgi:type II secretion system protein H